MYILKKLKLHVTYQKILMLIIFQQTLKISKNNVIIDVIIFNEWFEVGIFKRCLCKFVVKE